MKKLISELSEKEINAIIWRIENRKEEREFYRPCSDPAQSWPIIEREKITIYPYNGMWVALSVKSYKRIYGDTSLIAAMRCRIAMVYGDSVEVDDE
jgi:hypothetical protein